MKSALATLLMIPLSGFATSAQSIPEIHARTLADTTVNLPADLKGRIAVLILGFSKASSSQTKPWGEAISRDFGSDPHVVYYTMPVLADVPGFIRGFVVNSIRKQLPPGERGHFVAILKDAAPWKTLASFSGSDDAYIVVADAQGQQRWRTHGPWRADAYNEVKRRIQSLEVSSKPPV